MKFNRKFSNQVVATILIIVMLSSHCITVTSDIKHYRLNKVKTKTLNDKEVSTKSNRNSRNGGENGDENSQEEEDDFPIETNGETKENMKIQWSVVILNAIGCFSQAIQATVQTVVEDKEVEVQCVNYNCNKLKDIKKVYKKALEGNSNCVSPDETQSLSNQGRDSIQQDLDKWTETVKTFTSNDNCANIENAKKDPVFVAYEGFCDIYYQDIEEFKRMKNTITSLINAINDKGDVSIDIDFDSSYRNWLTVESFKKFPQVSKVREQLYNHGINIQNIDVNLISDLKDSLYIEDSDIAIEANKSFRMNFNEFMLIKYDVVD